MLEEIFGPVIIGPATCGYGVSIVDLQRMDLERFVGHQVLRNVVYILKCYRPGAGSWVQYPREVNDLGPRFRSRVANDALEPAFEGRVLRITAQSFFLPDRSSSKVNGS